MRMGYYCPVCGNNVGDNPIFEITGQCVCSGCGEIVDLENALDERPEDPEKDNLRKEEF
jgi:hypothetical protein